MIKASGQQEKEHAVLKLYAVLCQTAWVSQPGLNEDWTASYLGLLELGLPRFLKHAAALVLRRDKGYSDLVRTCKPGQTTAGYCSCGITVLCHERLCAEHRNTAIAHVQIHSTLATVYQQQPLWLTSHHKQAEGVGPSE